MKKEYRIAQNNSSLILVNKKTGAEGGHFETQVEAVSEILDMIKDSHISATHALELYEAILISPIRFQKITAINSDEAVTKRLRGISKMKLAHTLLVQLQISEAHDEPFLWICENCKNHGAIFLPGGKRSGTVQSKQEALLYIEDLYGQGMLNMTTKEKMMHDIQKSTLPLVNPNVASTCN